ncbi:uroporphyrinogen-III C-methyltransferase [Shewanella sp. D64]|uniref:uroporphyrinogen-III C-methyltransferase n=1 Tax=unclassified Shewanella TaxID=196818 RepID=UPI0022BA60CB|nr:MULTISPECIES: uroporphyrinogen-III C-methyltransferase [unclassified Shewanella]MEC4726179.1 uroporphyrinogen-III C-methyltransferase [Shewanella sp. D64]MEC4737905.1 uroporphyrinogen-III C-methyltransferase [Shewanella sp. E94]WBJ96108.1 uroporphyrinogen-III C-methyltransferase [Shewanella sp. MTB7]
MDNKELDENQQEPKNEVISKEKTLGSSTTEHVDESSTNRHSNKSSGVSWGFLFNLILILLLTFTTLGGGYYLHQELNRQTDQAQSLAQEVKFALAEPSKQISRLDQEQRQTEVRLIQELALLNVDQLRLNDRVAKLAQRNPNHWMAEEAKYLVRMAGSKLWLEKDPSTAASLLKAADQRIESMKDPALTPLRKALANDIAEVSIIKSTDIAGTILMLDSMIENLDQLPLNRADLINAANKVDNPDMTESIDDWQSNLAKSWQALIEDFIVVRKRTTDITPLLKPDELWYLVENIKNKLLQSQLALYRQDEVNYRQSLSLARKWIFQYFDLKNIQTQETLTALDALSTLEIQTPKIQQFASTPLLQQLVIHGNLMVSEEPSI